MKVAYFSPLPPERSGIADYSELLLAPLAERIDVSVVRRGARRPPPGTDVALYHVGNNPDAHGWIVDALRRHPGPVVLHEFVLHHLVAGMTLGRGDADGYLLAMEREAGVVGRLLAHGVLDGALPSLWEVRPVEFPLASWVLDIADGVLVHSRYVERRVRETGYEGAIWHVPHPSWTPPASPGDLGLPLGSPVIGCFGYVTPVKRIPQLLHAFARFHRRHPHATLVLAGAVSPRFELDARLERLAPAARDAVIRLDYVSEERLWALLAASDICVNLRSPTMGETSGIVIRALALGKPVVVTDAGWFSELPDSVAAKVPADEWEVDTLAAVLDLLATDVELRDQMGRTALAYVAREHDVERVAEAYGAALEEAAGGEAVREAVLNEVATAAAEVGITSNDPDLAELGRALREVRT